MKMKGAMMALVFVALWSTVFALPSEASRELRGEVCKDCLGYEGGSGTLTWRHLVEGSTTKPPRRLERFIYEGPNGLLVEVWMRLDKWNSEGGNQLHFFYFEAPEGKAENAKGFSVHHINQTNGAEVYRYDETWHAAFLYVPDFKRQTIFPEGSPLDSKVAKKKLKARAEARDFFTTRYPHLESFLCSASPELPQGPMVIAPSPCAREFALTCAGRTKTVCLAREIVANCGVAGQHASAVKTKAK